MCAAKHAVDCTDIRQPDVAIRGSSHEAKSPIQPGIK